MDNKLVFQSDPNKLRVYTPFVCDGESVVYAYGFKGPQNYLFAFSPEDGKELFRKELKSTDDESPDNMYLHNGNLVFTTTYTLYSIDPKTKTPRWNHHSKKGSFYKPVREGNRVYSILSRVLAESIIFNYGKTKDIMTAIDLDTGMESWTFDAAEPHISQFSVHRFIGDPRTYIKVKASSGKEYILDGASGKVLPALPAGKLPVEHAVFYNNVAYVVQGGRIRALSPADGSILGEYPADKPITGTVFGVGKGFYVRDGDGKTIRAFGSK